MGMHIMNYRAHTLGALLNVQPGKHGGTVVTCSLPKTQLKPETRS
jgi:nitrate/nitrite-specific signal transduction histidine kinase